MNINIEELRIQLLGHITRLECVYPQIWDIYCSDTNRNLLIGICIVLENDYVNNKKTLEEVIDTYNKLGSARFAPNWFDFSLDYAYVDNLKYKFDVPDEMLNKQKEFMVVVSETLYNESENSKEAIYLTADQYMINKLIKDMFSDLERLMDVFGEIYVQDVLKTFIINFWDKDILIKRAEDDNGLDLDCIAYKFDELFSSMIGDKPTFGQGVIMDLRKKLIDYFYEVNVRADIKIESLADDILMDVNEYVKDLKREKILNKNYGDCTICGHTIEPIITDDCAVYECKCPNCGAIFSTCYMEV